MKGGESQKENWKSYFMVHGGRRRYLRGISKRELKGDVILLPRDHDWGGESQKENWKHWIMAGDEVKILSKDESQKENWKLRLNKISLRNLVNAYGESQKENWKIFAQFLIMVAIHLMNFKKRIERL